AGACRPRHVRRKIAGTEPVRPIFYGSRAPRGDRTGGDARSFARHDTRPVSASLPTARQARWPAHRLRGAGALEPSDTRTYRAGGIYPAGGEVRVDPQPWGLDFAGGVHDVP